MREIEEPEAASAWPLLQGAAWALLFEAAAALIGAGVWMLCSHCK